MGKPDKVDRRAFSVVPLADHDKRDREYWWSKTPHERLEAIEAIRRAIYGYETPGQVQRIFEVTKLNRERS